MAGSTVAGFEGPRGGKILTAAVWEISRPAAIFVEYSAIARNEQIVPFVGTLSVVGHSASALRCAK